MNYYQKYLKYKNKYLELKKQSGGNPKKELFDAIEKNDIEM